MYCICPRCGRITMHFEKKTPKCDCCGYDNILDFSNDEWVNKIHYMDRTAELSKSFPEKSRKDRSKMVEEEDREKKYLNVYQMTKQNANRLHHINKKVYWNLQGATRLGTNITT